jgi:hypothetical protein
LNSNNPKNIYIIPSNINNNNNMIIIEKLLEKEEEEYSPLHD